MKRDGSKDHASASLQMSMSKLNSDTVLSPVVTVHPFSLSSPSGSQSRDFTDVPKPVESIQRRLDCFPAQIQCRAGSNSPTPVCVGRTICNMLQDVALPIVSVCEPSPSSPQMLGNAHIFGLSPNLQVPPRLVVVNPTPNLTPHPTPPASPLLASAANPRNNNHTGLEGTEGNLLTLPPNHYPYPNPTPPASPLLASVTNSRNNNHTVSSALAAKVKHTLADPLLPGQHKRTIVLTTSESEYEHSDDDGSWSSEEMGSEDEEVSFHIFYYFFFFITLCAWSLISPLFNYHRKGRDSIDKGKIGCWPSNSLTMPKVKH